MAPNKTHQISAEATPETAAIHQQSQNSPSDTSLTMSDTQQSPTVQESPSATKKRTRSTANNQRNPKRRRLSKSGPSSSDPLTPKHQSSSIPSKLDGMESWSTLLSYVDDFVSRGLIPEHNGRELRKMMRYKDQELKQMYNSLEGPIHERQLLVLLQLAHERHSHTPSPGFMAGTPGSYSDSSFASPQATPQFMSPTTPVSHTNASPYMVSSQPSDSAIAADQNVMSLGQVPSMQDILQQLSRLETGFFEREDSSAEETSTMMSHAKKYIHENSPSAKPLSQGESLPHQQYSNSQQEYNRENGVYQELSESELYNLLMSELGKNGDGVNSVPESESSRQQEECPSTSLIPSNDKNSNNNVDAQYFYQMYQLLGLDEDSSVSTPNPTPTSASAPTPTPVSNSAEGGEEMNFITSSLLNVDFSSPQGGVISASPGTNETLLSSCCNEESPLSLLLPLEENNMEQNNTQDFSLPEAPPCLDEYFDLYNAPEF